ncbi:hypothetical protein [Bradyrhizobium guangdongense]
MSYQVKPLPFDPKSISGISEKVLVSNGDQIGGLSGGILQDACCSKGDK